MGMAPGRRFFTLETLARRDGYTKEDVDGCTMAGDRYWSDEVGSPEVLGPRWSGWSAEDVWRRWKGGLVVCGLLAQRATRGGGYTLTICCGL